MDYYNSDIIDDPDYFDGFNKRFGAPIIDRSGILNDELKILTPLLPEARPGNKFKDIVDIKAKAILERAKKQNKDIKVSYSGGIDSTLVMSALSKIKDDYPSVKITVVMSKESIKEYPKFFGKHINKKFPVDMANSKNLAEVLAKKNNKDFFIVTGELGDQLFGSALMFRDAFKDKLDKDWEEVFTPKFVQFWSDLVEENPQQDFSAANVFWWLNFVLKYQWVQLRMFSMLDGKVPLQNFIHFFGGPRFQNWAMNTDMKVKFPNLKDEKTYKMPAKKYIYDFTGDKVYLKNKTKKGSLKENLDEPIRKNIDRITEDLELIKK